MEEHRVRISDIAEELGLSTATVSNVLHGKTKKISDETVKRVQACLEERQYVPSMAAILLAQNSSRIIGVVVNDHEKYEGRTLEDVFIASSLSYLSTEIEKQGRFMMVKKTREPEEIIRFASMWNLDGLVVIGFCAEDYRYMREHMRIPFVVYDGICENPERFVNIKIDDYDGGVQMGTYFRELGHKKALFLADNDMGVDRARYQGFCKGFCGEGSEGDFERNGKRDGKRERKRDGKKDRIDASADEAMQESSVTFMMIPMQKEVRLEFYEKQITKFHEVTAVFAASDYYAIDLIRFLCAHGIRVPEQISVAGFDDIPLCEMVTPALTTVRQNGELRAKIAVEKLQELRDKKETETMMVLPVSLVKRASTGAVKYENRRS